ncbi:MAG: H-NS histone family protein [Afipia sp.]|jgi:DNA-binding protein H-NS
MRHLDEMQFEELWSLHEKITKILTGRIVAEKRQLEKRLARLRQPPGTSHSLKSVPVASSDRPRRKYPKILPKYRNPSVLSETWSGRGKQPRWLVAALRRGHKIEDFRIAHAGASSDG